MTRWSRRRSRHHRLRNVRQPTDHLSHTTCPPSACMGSSLKIRGGRSEFLDRRTLPDFKLHRCQPTTKHSHIMERASLGTRTQRAKAVPESEMGCSRRTSPTPLTGDSVNDTILEYRAEAPLTVQFSSNIKAAKRGSLIPGSGVGRARTSALRLAATHSIRADLRKNVALKCFETRDSCSKSIGRKCVTTFRYSFSK